MSEILPHLSCTYETAVFLPPKEAHVPLTNNFGRPVFRFLGCIRSFLLAAIISIIILLGIFISLSTLPIFALI